MLTLNMVFTLNLDSDDLHRSKFSPKIWIQDKSAYTDDGFSLKYGFTKMLLTPKIPLIILFQNIFTNMVEKYQFKSNKCRLELEVHFRAGKLKCFDIS